jgi:hypothetical protein
MQRVAKDWGIADSDLFASATLLRPFKVHKSENKGPITPLDAFQSQSNLKERFRNMLMNEQLIPRVTAWTPSLRIGLAGLYIFQTPRLYPWPGTSFAFAVHAHRAIQQPSARESV